MLFVFRLSRLENDEDLKMNSGVIKNTKWLPPPAAGEFLGGTSTSTLAKWRLAGTGPVYSKAGKNVIYGDGDLSAYAESRRRRSTSDTGSEAA